MALKEANSPFAFLDPLFGGVGKVLEDTVKAGGDALGRAGPEWIRGQVQRTLETREDNRPEFKGKRGASGDKLSSDVDESSGPLGATVITNDLLVKGALIAAVVGIGVIVVRSAR